MRPQRAQPFPHDGTGALKTKPAQLLMQSNRGQIRVALKQLRDPIRIRIEQTRPRQGVRFHDTGPAILLFLQHAGHALAIDPEHAGDTAPGTSIAAETNDFVAGDFIHAVFISLTRSRLSADTDPASRDSF